MEFFSTSTTTASATAGGGSEEKQNNVSSMKPADDANEFWLQFNQMKESFKFSLAALYEEKDQSQGGEMDVQINRLKDSISSMQKYATISTIVLPAYDIRRSQELIQECNKELSSAQTKLKPRKKFTFASRRNKAAASDAVVAASEVKDQQQQQQQQVKEKKETAAVTPLLGTFTISNRRNETCTYTAADLFTTAADAELLPQIYLTGNDNCTFIIGALLGSVRIDNSTNCRIFLGACGTSVYLERVQSSVIFIASHQLRIHDCSDCHLYVRCHSHPIIEDCNNIGFAPYSFEYDESEQAIQKAGLQNAHCWDNVKDFRWHKSIPSPNWFVIPVEQRITRNDAIDSTTDPGKATDEGSRNLHAKLEASATSNVEVMNGKQESSSSSVAAIDGEDDDEI